MPYITQDKRDCVDGAIIGLLAVMKNSPDYENNKAGMMNYVLTNSVGSQATGF